MAIFGLMDVVNAQGNLHDLQVSLIVFTHGYKLGLAVCHRLVIINLFNKDLQSLDISIFSVINNRLNCCFRLLLALITDPQVGETRRQFGDATVGTGLREVLGSHL